jgi:hypothetical protein
MEDPEKFQELCDFVSLLPYGQRLLDQSEKNVSLSMFSLSLPRIPNLLQRLAPVKKLFADNCPLLSCLPETLGQLAKLNTIQINCCHSLTSLPETVGQLTTELKVLSIIDCAQFTRLPESIGQSSALTEIYIYKCGLIGLPKSTGQLKALTLLTITDCPVFTHLPESVGQLSALTKMKITSCPAFKYLPDTVGAITTLIDLDLAYSGITHFPTTLWLLPELQWIVLCKTGVTEIMGFVRDPRSDLHIIQPDYSRTRVCSYRSVILTTILCMRRRRRHMPDELWLKVVEDYAEKFRFPV